MSVFTNPASSAPDRAREYVAAVLDLLGDRSPLEVLGSTAHLLDRAVGTLSADEITRPEAAGNWSVRDVLQHLADSEVVWGFRLRMALGQDRPPLAGYDQDMWVARLHYEDADPREAMALFTALRRSNLRLVKAASPADLQRVAVHAERGEQTVDEIVRLNAGHDLVHLNQIARIKAAILS